MNKNKYNNYIGKTIDRFDHTSVNVLTIYFTDGSKLELEASTMYIGNGMSLGTIQANN